MTRLICRALHAPPFGVGILRLVSSAAIRRSDSPWPCNSRIVGASFSARCFASARHFGASTSAPVRPKRVPRCLATARPALVRSLIRPASSCPFRKSYPDVMMMQAA